jgi:GH35 family endo-1,4-beta-xylanase
VGTKAHDRTQVYESIGTISESTYSLTNSGGSGLFTHITKRCNPEAKVIYNDFDNYHKRLEKSPRTNRLIADLPCHGKGIPFHGTRP